MDVDDSGHNMKTNDLDSIFFRLAYFVFNA